MNPKHCVSLGIARQLKEAGWKQPAEFLWFDSKFKDKPNEVFLSNSNLRCRNDFVDWVAYYAPIATELLEELPEGLIINKCQDIYRIRQLLPGFVHHDEDKFLPNALARIWLYLKEKGLLCPKSTGGITYVKGKGEK